MTLVSAGQTLQELRTQMERVDDVMEYPDDVVFAEDGDAGKMKEIENFFNPIPVLETERLLLRKIELDDVDDLFEIFSDPQITDSMTWEVNQTKDDTLNKFIKVVTKRHEEAQSVDWAIVLKENDKVIGNCAFIDWSNRHSKAEIGYVMNKAYWGKGLATEGVLRKNFKDWGEYEALRDGLEDLSDAIELSWLRG